ncbi:2Fe-2S iron-sulfur cluster-binding protein [Shewanella sp. MF05960]|uniref:2Fe-2S iron-sulfur cluster-binding protein n=1 Tax=Shewanella sp. MF05960 TaxID=3434874 RepID=UPI003D7C11CD
MLSMFTAKAVSLTINDTIVIEQASVKQTVLASALAADIAFPHHCQVGSCGACRCQLVSGEVKQLTDSAYVLSAKAIAQGMILACQSVPKSAVNIKVNLRQRQLADEPQE